jgi:ribosomal protein L12E/L44/L45/RPP1/RPP2
MLGLFAVEVVCTHVEEQIINTALAKMEEVEIDDLMLVTQQPS